MTATVTTTGSNGQLVARLWDGAPNGQQLLVTRGVYRLLDAETGAITFQLHGNGYRFAGGHTVKLELLGADSPYYPASNNPFAVRVSAARVSLPVLEAPGSTPQIGTNPYAAAEPRGGREGRRRQPVATATADDGQARALAATGPPVVLAAAGLAAALAAALLRRAAAGK